MLLGPFISNDRFSRRQFPRSLRLSQYASGATVSTRPKQTQTRRKANERFG